MRSATDLDRTGLRRPGARRRFPLPALALLGAFAFHPARAVAGPEDCVPDACATDIKDLSSLTAEGLAKALVGPNIAIGNVRFTGAPAAAGLVTHADAAVYGLTRGIVLSSGCVRNIHGPNSSPAITCDHGARGDADLDAITGIPSSDAAVLEFDFVPSGPGDLVHLRYVFASEEYNDWVGAGFNDTFAFLVNGRNVTFVPGTRDPVQIAMVHNGNPRGMNRPKNAHLYRDNDVWDPMLPIPAGIDTEMDGMTVVLAAEARVNPGAVNHIKIVIGDLGDGMLDSNVILQAGSFTTGCADTDLDGVCDGADNCVFAANPGQEDRDKNGRGDACDEPAPPAPKNTPPVARCQSRTIRADLSCAGCASIDAGSFDPDGDPIVCRPSVECPYKPGANLVTLTCVDPKGASDSCQAVITVEDATPPAIACPADMSLACGAVATFTTSASDNCGRPAVHCAVPSGSRFPPGTTVNHCTATDAAGNTASCAFRVRVMAGPPVVTPKADAAGVSAWLWPPNHKYHNISLADCIAAIKDGCGTNLPVAAHARIIRVTSDEPENTGKGGDGNTYQDILIGKDGQSVQLRAERMGGTNGKGPGRVYRIHYVVTDGHGGQAPGACVVAVSHDQGPRAQAIDTCQPPNPGPHCDRNAPRAGAHCVPGPGLNGAICAGYGAL